MIKRNTALGHLGFSEQASFSRFFKGYEGVSPKVFRERE